MMDHKEIFAHTKLRRDCTGLGYDNIKTIVQETVEEYSKIDDDNTNPGLVILKKQPDFEEYQKTVRGIVALQNVKNVLHSSDAYYKGYKNCRGLIGATAAIAWSPVTDKTYELITYRESNRWGTKRSVDDESTKTMDKTCTSTFDNYDYLNNHNRLVPNSLCPVLYGIRGDVHEDVIRAYSMIESEPVESWIIFETNQGTDDHLQKITIGGIQPYQSVIVEGSVSRNPSTIEGGHVIFTINDATGTIDCAAYEPTKQFRTVIRELVVGDIVEVYGGVRDNPLTVNIEKIDIKHLTKIVEKVENPLCPQCGKHMKSKGTQQGYKCKHCGTVEKKPILREKQRAIQTGFYEAPVCVRRHLSKPLKRVHRVIATAGAPRPL